MIYDKNKKLIKPYSGNYKPLNIYQGRKKIAGYTNKVATGTSSVVMENTYNEKFRGKVFGNSIQENSTQRKNLIDLTKLELSFITSTSIFAVNSTETNSISFDVSPSMVAWANARFNINELLKHGSNYIFGVKANDDNQAIIGTNGENYYGTIGINRIDKGLPASASASTANKTEIQLFNTNMYIKAFSSVDLENYDYYLIFFPVGQWASTLPENTTLKYEQIYLAEETSFSGYEEFIPNKPSIDYPSEIVSLDLDNLESYNQNLLIKDGWSTDVNDTDFWSTIAKSRAIPLENGWIRVTADNTEGTKILYSNFRAKKEMLKNIKPNTIYTFLLETRNKVGNALKLEISSNISAEPNCFNNFSCSWDKLEGTIKQNVSSKSSFSDIAIGLRTMLVSNPGQSGSIELRLTLVEDDYTNKPLHWNKHRSNSIEFPLNEPLRAIECTSSGNWNVQKDGKYYIADYVDWERKKTYKKINTEVITGNGTNIATITSDSECITFYCQNVMTDMLIPSLSNYVPVMMSDKFKIVDVNSAKTILGEHLSIQKAGNYTRLYVTIRKTRLDGFNESLTNLEKVALFNDLVLNNPITIDYLISTPIEIDFTPEQNAIADLYLTPNYCNLTVESNIEPLAIEVPYSEMEVE